MRFALTLSFVLLAGCGDPAPSPSPPTPVAVPAQPAAVAPEVAPVEVAPAEVTPVVPVEPAAPRVRAGDIVYIEGESDVRVLLLDTEPSPQPASPIVGYVPLHHARRDVRVIDAPVEQVSTALVLDGTTLCEAPVARTRLLHTVLIDEEETVVGDPRTYLGLELEGCPSGQTGIVGIERSAVRVSSLRRDALRTHASPELVEAVRHVDDGIWGGDPLRGDAFRMLALPTHDVTFVVGTAAWVVRDGVVLSGPEPITLIEAGPLVYLEVETPSESWSTSLDAFQARPPQRCEVIDTTPMNVRAEARGGARVVTTLAPGAHITANDAWGMWRHLSTSPPGWAHQSGLRCE